MALTDPTTCWLPHVVSGQEAHFREKKMFLRVGYRKMLSFNKNFTHPITVLSQCPSVSKDFMKDGRNTP